MHNLGNIFLYNNHAPHDRHADFLKQQGYFLFDTDNLHRFGLYNKEVTPDVLVFDFTHNTTPDFIASVLNKNQFAPTPILVISDLPKALIYNPAVSHYLSHTSTENDLNDIMESYTIGNKNHQILYINLKPFERPDFVNSAKDRGFSIFEVHNLQSARRYMQKNTPSVICINFLPALQTSQKLFTFPKTFYVENSQNVEEIARFLS